MKNLDQKIAELCNRIRGDEIIDKKIKENVKDIICDLQTDLEEYEARLDVEADPDQVGWLVNQTMYMQDQIDQYEEILNELK